MTLEPCPFASGWLPLSLPVCYRNIVKNRDAYRIFEFLRILAYYEGEIGVVT